MSSPRIICKSGCIKSIQHFLNTIEYSGNKIESQSIMFKDGSVLKEDADKKIRLSPAEAQNVAGIYLEYKDGGGKSLTYEQYQKYAEKTTETITVSELEAIQDGSKFIKGSSGPHEMKDLDFFKYLPYIEDREGVQKSADGHGLFGVNGDVPIEEARDIAMLYENNRKWSHIISIADRGESTGFDNREMWKNLVASIAPQIAKKYNISLENLIINAAFHINTDNAHIHLCFYSSDSTEGFIKGGKPAMNEASNYLKSLFVNRIYKDEISSLNQAHNRLRTELTKQLDISLKNLVSKDYSRTELADMLTDLSCNIDSLNGKTSYGYLPKASKDKVNDILKWVIEKDDDANALFEAVKENHREYVLQYQVKPQKVQREMNSFIDDFYNPKKGRGLAQNLIVNAAKELNKPCTEALRTAEGKIVDYKTADPALSIVFDEIPLPADEDIPLSGDFDTADFGMADFADLGKLHSPEILRATEEEIFDYKTADHALSIVFDEIPLPADEDIPPPGDFDMADFGTADFADLGELHSPEALRAAEEEIFDYKAADPALSIVFDEFPLPADEDAPLPGDFDMPDFGMADFDTADFGMADFADLGELYSPEALRAAEEEIFDYKTADPALSIGNQARYCFNQMKPKLREFRSVLFKAMRSAYVNGSFPNHLKVKAIFDNSKDIQNLDLDYLMNTLSSENFNFSEKKDFLMYEFCSQMKEKFSVGEDISKELFDKFFYERDNKHCTLSLRKIICSFAEERSNILSSYQSHHMKYVCSTLLQGIGRILYAQTIHHQANERSERNNLQNKKQFKNQRQFVAPQISKPQNEISY